MTNLQDSPLAWLFPRVGRRALASILLRWKRCRVFVVFNQLLENSYIIAWSIGSSCEAFLSTRRLRMGESLYLRPFFEVNPRCASCCNLTSNYDVKCILWFFFCVHVHHVKAHLMCSTWPDMNVISYCRMLRKELDPMYPQTTHGDLLVYIYIYIHSMFIMTSRTAGYLRLLPSLATSSLVTSVDVRVQTDSLVNL